MSDTSTSRDDSASIPADMPVGFPPAANYLPNSTDNSMAESWPRANRQLDAFFRCVARANEKLPTRVNLPQQIGACWVREWAEDLVLKTFTSCSDASDIRAEYEFGRKLDELVCLTNTPLEHPMPSDVEFTFYDRPLLRHHATTGELTPDPLACTGHYLEDRFQYMPTVFPRSQVRLLPHSPRLMCFEFLEWAGFLTAPDALNTEQLCELGHVGYSTEVRQTGCLRRGTYGEQFGRFAPIITQRLRLAIRRVSDANRLAVGRVSETLPFATVLDDVSEWLTRPDVVALMSDVRKPSETNQPNGSKGTGNRQEPPASVRPVWDAAARTLTFGEWSHEYVRSAPAQERVLAAFQKAGWPWRVVKELPDHLSGIIRNMGTTLGDGCPIEFEGDGTGGVRWKVKSERSEVSDK